jgi:hypothetical protein
VSKNSPRFVEAIRGKFESPIRVPETPSAFSIRAHDEAVTVVAMCLCNPDRSPVAVNR